MKTYGVGHYAHRPRHGQHFCQRANPKNQKGPLSYEGGGEGPAPSVLLIGHSPIKRPLSKQEHGGLRFRSMLLLLLKEALWPTTTRVQREAARQESGWQVPFQSWEHGRSPGCGADCRRPERVAARRQRKTRRLGRLLFRRLRGCLALHGN